MSNKGFSHIGLSTLDLDRTGAFYEDVLGFKAVVADDFRIQEGGRLRHIFFDVGRDQLLAFMEARDVPGVPAHFQEGEKLIAPDVEEHVPKASAFVDFQRVGDNRLEPQNAFIERACSVEVESREADMGKAFVAHVPSLLAVALR